MTVAICLPCFILIGSLNSRAGVVWWRSKSSAFWDSACRMWPWSKRVLDEKLIQTQEPTNVARTSASDYPLPSDISTNAKMARRLRRLSSNKNGDRERPPQSQNGLSEEALEPLEDSLQWGEPRQMSRRMSEMIDTLPMEKFQMLKKQAENSK